MRIDSHQHFWKYHPVKDSWIGEHMEVLKNDFMPADVIPMLLENKVDGCIAVQADQSEQETMLLLDLAEQYDFIKGVVGWIDLSAANVGDRLAYFSQFPKLKGFRHIVQSEPDTNFLLRPDFCRGISMLKDFNYTYDILIYPKHLPVALEFARRFPEQTFILDHLAKPLIKNGVLSPWREELLPFRSLRNVSCKMAGLVTEADWQHWKMEDFQQYVDTVFDVFGPDRMIFGTDWPVCTLAASYSEVVDVLAGCTSFLTLEQQGKLWGGNCSRIYRLG